MPRTPAAKPSLARLVGAGFSGCTDHHGLQRRHGKAYAAHVDHAVAVGQGTRRPGVRGDRRLFAERRHGDLLRRQLDVCCADGGRHRGVFLDTLLEQRTCGAACEPYGPFLCATVTREGTNMARHDAGFHRGDVRRPRGQAADVVLHDKLHMWLPPAATSSPTSCPTRRRCGKYARKPASTWSW